VADPDEDNDIVVLGDFNHCHTAPKAEILSNGAFGNFLSGSKGGQSIIHFDRQIDHIVPLGTFEEIDTRSFRVHSEGLRDKNAWRDRYSDHFPVTATLEAVRDDDPKARFTAPRNRLP
jgi:endonuclease/exonuclease/phosphatase family metal-dependent hydrolase